MTTVDLHHAETRTISIAAPPSAVLDVLGDARRLPKWAPAFAQAVHEDGPHWLVDSGGAQLRIDVHVERGAGTVDLLAAGQPTMGAFLRVVPNGTAGSEVVFVLFFPPGTESRTIAEQMHTVVSELQALRSLCDTHPA